MENNFSLTRGGGGWFWYNSSLLHLLCRLLLLLLHQLPLRSSGVRSQRSRNRVLDCVMRYVPELVCPEEDASGVCVCVRMPQGCVCVCVCVCVRMPQGCVCDDASGVCVCV